jgi:putative SOS response-associated peptidase YedK
MCNHYRADARWVERTGEFSHLRIPLRFSHAPGNYVPPVHLYPGRDGTVFRLSEDGQALEPAIMRWGLIPGFWRKSIKEWKASCQNCVSEDMSAKASFRGALARRRCVVPADAFYESCGRGTMKEWEITRRDGGPFLFAGLWDRASTTDGEVESYTILTSSPGPDVAQWHNRQLISLAAEDVEVWLDPAQPHDRLIQQPTEAGLLEAVVVPIRGKGTEAAP